MSSDIGKLVIERLQKTSSENIKKSLLTENQLKMIIGEKKDEQRSGKG